MSVANLLDISVPNDAVAQLVPIAYWPLTVNALDESGSENNGAASFVSFDQVVPGDNKTCSLFTSANDSNILTSFNTTGQTSFSVSVWINMDNLSQSGNPRLINNSHTDAQNTGFEFYLQSGTSPFFYVGNGSSVGFAKALNAVAATGWVHIAGTWTSGSAPILYVNGVSVSLLSSSAMTGSVSAGTAGTNNPSGTVIIGGGAGSDTHDWYNGYMTGASIFGSVLTPTQVAAIYAAGPNPVANGTISLTGPDSTFEGWTGNWSAQTNCSVAQTTTQVHTGSYSMALTQLNNVGGAGIAIGPTFIALPGALFSMSAWYFTTLFGQVNNIGLQFLGAGNAIIETVLPSANTPLTASAWTQVVLTGVPAPAGTLLVQPVVFAPGGTPVNQVTYVDDVVLSWANYATNMCPNPSFETDLTGWTAAKGTETLTQYTYLVNDSTIIINESFSGNSSLQVQTPGVVQNEGVTGPLTVMPTTNTGSMSCELWGETGTILVECIDQTAGNTVLAAQLVQLGGTGGSTGTKYDFQSNELLADPPSFQLTPLPLAPYWTIAELTNLNFIAGHQVYIAITTFSPQAITFSIDAVMYQPEAPVDYFDGDTTGGFWTGTAEESASYIPFQFGLYTATMHFFLTGTANTIDPTVIVQAIPQALDFTFSFGPQNTPLALITSPAAAMTDFGIWESSDPDPAQTYGIWNNSGFTTGTGGSWNRGYMTFAPPLDQFTSSGEYNWKRAAYIAQGWQLTSHPVNATYLLADAQTEMVPINGYPAPASPTTYQKARQLQVIVRPSRLNYITNPSFEAGTTNWSQIGSGTSFAISGNVPVIPDTVYGNINYGSGSASLAVTATSASSAGIQISVPYLIPGRTYMFSAWIYPDGEAMVDLSGSIFSTTGFLATIEATGYDDGTPYGSGPYGGIFNQVAPLPPQWMQIFFSFVATTDTGTLELAPVLQAGPSFPYTWLVDAVLIEDGDILNPYFDGNSGPDALWLTGGTANLCQSFLYDQLQYGQHVITDALNNNTPHGISYASPQYAVMPTQ